MSWTGITAIVVGLLMILPLQRQERSTLPSWPWLRYLLACIGTWFVTAGMASVVQARF
jgi:hypothetical protein